MRNPWRTMRLEGYKVEVVLRKEIDACIQEDSIAVKEYDESVSAPSMKMAERVKGGH